MTAEAAFETLAGELAGVLLRGDPFGASFMSVPGYDDAVPDLAPEYQQAWRGRIVDVIARCARGACQPRKLPPVATARAMPSAKNVLPMPAGP